MRFVAALSVLVVLVVAAPAIGAERGTIRGRIVNETTGEPQGGVRVRLEALNRNEDDPVTYNVVTGADGRYSFEDLRTGNDWLYVIDARHDGGLFPGRPLTIPANTSEPPVIETTLRVWDTTSDPASVLVRRDNLFAVADEDKVGIIESVTIVNTTNLAYIGRGEKNTGSAASFGFPLPDSADTSTVRIEDAPFDVPRLVPTSFGFALTVAIPPGESQVVYSYQVTGGTGTFDLSRTMLYPTLEMSTFAEEPLEIESSRLAAGGEVDIEDRVYRRWSSSDTLDAGDPVQILAIASGAPSWWVFAAAGAGVVLLILLAFFVARRRPRADEPVRDAPPERDDLVAAIASLDLEFETGTMTRAEWEQRRTELKTKLQEMSTVG